MPESRFVKVALIIPIEFSTEDGWENPAELTSEAMIIEAQHLALEHVTNPDADLNQQWIIIWDGGTEET